MSRKRVAMGVVWNLAEQFGKRGISFLVSLILAQFLTPDDFGVVAIVAVVSAIASASMESGLRDALIRTEYASELDYNTAFWANLALAGITYLVAFWGAPLIAAYYHEVGLTSLIRVAAVTIFFNMFQIVPSAILSRKLSFSAQFRIGMVSGALSALVAIVLVSLGFGVWALVMQMLTSSIISALGFSLIRVWRPRLLFSRAFLVRLMDFGYKIYLSSLLEIFFSNLYVLAIAKVFLAGVAGLYFFAEKIRDILVGQLVNSIQMVTYPALSVLQNDPLRLKNACREVLLVTTFLVFPAMLLLAALSVPLFKAFFPDAWWPAAGYLQLMGIAGALYPLHAINLNFLKVRGRSDLYLYIEIFKKILTLVILMACLSYGVTGILLGQIVGSIVAYVANSFFSKSMVGYPLLEQITDFLPSLLLAGVLAFVAYGCVLAVNWPEFVKIICIGSGFLLLYISAARAFEMRGYILARDAVARIVGASGRGD
jgi:O-antigen/teichoic acid export membrane protein